jgi:hypothetical protein
LLNHSGCVIATEIEEPKVTCHVNRWTNIQMGVLHRRRRPGSFPGYKWGLLLALLGFGIISALYDWKRTLEVTAFTIAAATLVPSVFYLPCFVFHAIRLRSMAKAREHTWENWKSVADLYHSNGKMLSLAGLVTVFVLNAVSWPRRAHDRPFFNLSKTPTSVWWILELVLGGR